MTRFTIILDGTGIQPDDNYGCKCASCRERWGRRTTFQNEVVVRLCAERPEIAAGDVWQASIDICNTIDFYNMTYLGLAWEDLNVVTQDAAQEHPELIHGAPIEATLQ